MDVCNTTTSGSFAFVPLTRFSPSANAILVGFDSVQPSKLTKYISIASIPLQVTKSNLRTSLTRVQ